MEAVILLIIVAIVIAFIWYYKSYKEEKEIPPKINPSEGPQGRGTQERGPQERGTQERGTQERGTQGGGIEGPKVKPPLETGPTQGSSGTQYGQQVAPPKKVKPPYNICYVPFLPNAKPKLDYSSISKVTYVISNSIEDTFPIVRAPQLGNPIKKPVIGRKNYRGASEEYFCNKIVEYGLQSHFYDNLSLFIKDVDFPYEPDLAYINETQGVFLDIEIDEPYAGWDRLPIHYKTSKGKTIDDLRNQHFTERGWTVIRFSEKQIREQTMSCLKEIFILLNKMSSNIIVPKVLKNVKDLSAELWWTQENALQMMKNKEREKLLGISKFLKPKKEPIISLKDYENGKLVEDKVIKYKDDSCWRECKRKDDFTRYKRQFPNGKHIEEVEQMEDDKLYKECVSQKKYTLYMNVSKTKKYVVEVKELIQKQEKEKQRREEEERQRKARELEKIKDQELRKQEEQRKRKQEERLRREQEEQRKLEAERYERQSVTTSNPSPKTPSSRGYA